VGVTENIASFVARTTAEDIPSEVFARAKRHVIDTLGVGIGASRGPIARILSKVVRGEKAGEAFLWDGSGRASASDAAWANGTLAHALDFDDGGVAPTPMHPSSPVLPAVWALGESRNLSGKEALSAYIVGLEVECKIASAISLSHYDHGWHATGVLGVLGAVAGASRLAGLSREKVRTALGIVASMAGGLRANFGTMTKPLHAGLAARNGLMATLLAEAGWSANPDILDAEKGFLNVFGCGEVRPLDSLGNPFHFLSPGVSIKRFPTCSATHLCIEALLGLKQEYPIAADQVESIECGVHALSHEVLMKEPRVETPEQARFSLYFAMAVVLLEGSIELKHFASDTLGREDVRALMKRVKVYVHPELRDLESKRKHFGQVSVRLKDGSFVSKKETRVRGRAPLFLEDSEVDAKFCGCVEQVLGGRETQDLLDRLHHLESLKELKALFPAAYGLA
jgi:2-methylcitrate dehydratase PrpD